MKHNITKPVEYLEVIDADTGLTSLQEKCAMMLASGSRISDVARGMKVSRGTLYRWMGQLPFHCYLNYLKKDLKDNVECSLIKMHTKAIRAMDESLESDNESVKLRASMWLLEKVSAMEVGETDVRQAIKAGIEEGKIDSFLDTKCLSELEDMGIDL